MAHRLTCVLALASGMACSSTLLAQERTLELAGGISVPRAPRTPVHTTLAFQGQPIPGQPATLVFTVTLDKSVAQTNATVDFQLPHQVSSRGGALSVSAPLVAGEPREFPISVTLDAAGSCQITASVIAGDEDYTFGQRRTLYLTVAKDKVLVSAIKPTAADGPECAAPTLINPDDQVVTTRMPEEMRHPAPPVGELPTTDRDGMPLGPDAGMDEGGEFGERATTTITGGWRYRHGDGTLHTGYGTVVYAWDDDNLDADDLLGSAIVDDAGGFSITFDNNTDSVFEGGTADVYVEFRTTNGVCNVHTNGGSGVVFTTATGVVLPNVAGGNQSVGSWFADWGTNGVADSNERAWEVMDYMSRAWAHANYTLGYGPHYTYTQWYDGSVDGTYYNPPTNRIHLHEMDFNSPDVLMHEFGHNLMDSVYAEVWVPGSGGAHSFTGHYNQALAWTEGWATWFSCSAQGNDWIYNDNNPGNFFSFNCDSNWDGNGSANGNSDNLSNNPNWGYDTESAVLAMLLDLDDSRNDSTDLYDWTSLADNEIWDVTANYDPAGANPKVYGVQQFYDGWFARGWGSHPQVNGQMLVHGMNQGITKPVLGLYDGVNKWSGTWYYGGYGRGSYDVKNYGSQNYDLNQMYVWLRGPANQDIGQFGGDGNGAVIPARTTRNIWLTAAQTGYNPAAPNWVYGNYTITAGHYRSDGAWQLLEVAESGTAQQITANVVADTDAPDYCNAYDDGAAVNTPTQLHVLAYATDNDSSIQGYWTRVGTSAGAGNTQDWVFHAANNQTTFDYTITGLTTVPNTLYYITVVARNIEGYDTWAYTDGIITGDTSPPGPVTVVDDGIATANLTQLHFNATSSEPNGEIYGYWTRVGTSPGSGNEQDWVFHATGDVDVFNYTITGLTMTPKKKYYITVVARNVSGLDTFGYSNGIVAGLSMIP